MALASSSGRLECRRCELPQLALGQPQRDCGAGEPAGPVVQRRAGHDDADQARTAHSVRAALHVSPGDLTAPTTRRRRLSGRGDGQRSAAAGSGIEHAGPQDSGGLGHGEKSGAGSPFAGAHGRGAAPACVREPAHVSCCGRSGPGSCCACRVRRCGSESAGTCWRRGGLCAGRSAVCPCNWTTPRSR